MIYLFSSSPRTISAYFEENGVDYTLITKSSFAEFLDIYKPNSEDLGIVYDFGKIIPQKLLEVLYLVNIHFSLLPKYRGATPVEAAILAGEAETGISIQKMVKEMDAGDIILSKRVAIQPEWTAGELQAYMDAQLPEMLEELFSTAKEEWTLIPQKGEPTFCYMSLLDRANAQLKPLHMTTSEMLQAIRAYNPEPLAWLEVKRRSGQISSVNILRAIEYNGQIDGSFQFVKKQGLVVKASDGNVLITELVPAGQKLLKGGDIVSLKGQFELL